MMETIRIGIAEDHDLVRQGLVALLNEEEGLKVCCEANNGQKLVEFTGLKDLDVVLMDLDMPVMNGQQALKIIRSTYPSVKVIMVSMHYSDDFIAQSIKLGARGYLPKNCTIEKVIDAIYAVHQQGYYFDDKVSKALLFKLVDDEEITPTFSSDVLTKREKEVMECICKEMNNHEIAETLFISNRTVEAHRQNILKKTHAKNAAGVVIYAIKNGLFQIPESSGN